MTHPDQGKAFSELEASLDESMRDSLALLKDCFPQVHTAGIFFPGHAEGWRLRVCISDAPSLILNVQLTSQQGLVARLMKEDVARVFEGDIPADSTRLHYYSKDEGVRSLIAVPIFMDGARRGAVFLDSLKANAFDAHALKRLTGFARSVGMLAHHAHSSFEHSQNHEQLQRFSNYQIKFLEKMSREHIVEVALEYMRASIDAEQYFVAARVESDADQIEVVAAEGLDAGSLRGFRFAPGDGGLVHLAFKDSDQVVNRTLRGSKAVFRMSSSEPYQPMLQGFLAAPISTENGVEMVLCVASSRRERFSDFHQNLLLTIARSAGFALSRARVYQEKEELASRDGLTGLCNHRVFQERLRDELLRAQRHEGKVSVLMMDLDRFKTVNDTYGHSGGDAVLRDTGRILTRTLREGMDLVARYGGEEFVCMLPDTDASGAHETAERIRRTLEEHEFKPASSGFHLTVSIGGAVFPEDARQCKELLEKADKALYKAKESGRNKVIFYH